MLRGGRRSQRGIALVLVLWVVSLLSVMALSVAASVRTGMLLARNALDALRDRALVGAAEQFASIQLVSGLLAQPRPPEEEGLPIVLDWRFEERPIQIQIRSEAERLDLNQAGPEDMHLALDELGIDPALRDRLVDTIQDWRDPDAFRGLHGAEDGDYTAAGMPYGSKDQPFETVDELKGLLGFPRELWSQLRDTFTVGDGRINPPPQAYDEAGSGQVGLPAMPQGTGRGAERPGRARRPPVTPQRRANRSAHGSLYRLQIAYGGEGGAQRGAEGLVSLGGGSGLPFQVLWTRYDVPPPPAVAPVPLQVGKRPGLPR
jgi:general secretion pathway protein K